jgi:hypothetical protein
MAKFSMIARSASFVAATLFVAGATLPASAANDPVAAAKVEVAAKPAAKKLSRAALSAVYCVNTPAADGGEVTKECKSRGAWIKEGRDPFAK